MAADDLEKVVLDGDRRPVDDLVRIDDAVAVEVAIAGEFEERQIGVGVDGVGNGFVGEDVVVEERDVLVRSRQGDQTAAGVADQVVVDRQFAGDDLIGAVAEGDEEVSAVVGGVDVEEVVIDFQTGPRPLDAVCLGQIVVVKAEAVAGRDGIGDAGRDAAAELGDADDAVEIVVIDGDAGIVLERQLDGETGQDRVVVDPRVAKLSTFDAEHVTAVGLGDAVLADDAGLLKRQEHRPAGAVVDASAGVVKVVAGDGGVVGPEQSQSAPCEIADGGVLQTEAVGVVAVDRPVQPVAAGERQTGDGDVAGVVAQVQQIGGAVGGAEVGFVIGSRGEVRGPRAPEGGSAPSGTTDRDAGGDVQRAVKVVDARGDVDHRPGGSRVQGGPQTRRTVDLDRLGGGGNRGAQIDQDADRQMGEWTHGAAVRGRRCGDGDGRFKKTPFHFDRTLVGGGTLIAVLTRIRSRRDESWR